MGYNEDSATWSMVGGFIGLGVLSFLLYCCFRHLCCPRNSSPGVILVPRRPDPPPQHQAVIVQNYAPQPYIIQSSPSPQQFQHQPAAQIHSPELHLSAQYPPMQQQFQQFSTGGQKHNPAVAPSPYGAPPM